MGNITIALSKGHEMKLRKLARKKFGSRKGSLSKVISEALDTVDAETRREAAVRELKETMSKGFNLGRIAVKHRSELYDRR